MIKNGDNNGKYSNPEVEEIIANDVPITVLYQVNKYYVVNDRISNYAFSPVNSDMFAEVIK